MPSRSGDGQRALGKILTDNLLESLAVFFVTCLYRSNQCGRFLSFAAEHFSDLQQAGCGPKGIAGDQMNFMAVCLRQKQAMPALITVRSTCQHIVSLAQLAE